MTHRLPCDAAGVAFAAAAVAVSAEMIKEMLGNPVLLALGIRTDLKEWSGPRAGIFSDATNSLISRSRFDFVEPIWTTLVPDPIENVAPIGNHFFVDRFGLFLLDSA